MGGFVGAGTAEGGGRGPGAIPPQPMHERHQTAAAGRGLNRSGEFVLQDQQISAVQFSQSHGAAFGIEEFDLKYVGREKLDDGANLSGDQALVRLVFQQRDDIQKCDRCGLHDRFITRNTSPSESEAA